MVIKNQTTRLDGATQNATLKLLKYDLKWIYKVIAPLYLALIGCAILARLFGLIENSVIFEIVTQIFVGATIALMVNLLINSVARSWTRFIRNIYKDESYLTHTLPVTSNAIFRAKTLAALATIFTTIVMIVLSFFIAFYSDELIEGIKSSLQIIAETYNTSVIAFLLLIAVVFFVEIMLAVLIGYVGIILGYRSNKSKVAKSIVFGLIIYSISQIVALGALVVYGVFNPEIMNLINTQSAISLDAMKSIMYFAIGIYLAYNIVLYFIGQKLLARGVNVD